MGGGPVGLGLAIELSQRGVDTIVLERSTDLHAIPKGQNLTQRSMEHMAVWGVEHEIRSARVLPTDFPAAGVNTFGAILSDLSTPWFRRSDVSPFYWTDNERLPQYETERVLRRRAEELTSVVYGAPVSDVQPTSEGVVVTHEHGTVAARYAVGCDGARSTVRTRSGITETRRDHDKRMVLLVARSPELHHLLEDRYGHVSFVNSVHPDLDGYWQFLGRVDDSGTFFFHQPVRADVDDPLPVLVRAVGQDVEAEILYKGYWDLRVTYADAYRSGPVFIAGDAAHSHPPYGGYGINTGFEDVRNLGWKLAAVLDGWADDTLLDTYTEERRAVFESTARDLIEAFIQRDRDVHGAPTLVLPHSSYQRVVSVDRQRLPEPVLRLGVACHQLGCFAPPAGIVARQHVHRTAAFVVAPGGDQRHAVPHRHGTPESLAVDHVTGGDLGALGPVPRLVPPEDVDRTPGVVDDRRSDQEVVPHYPQRPPEVVPVCRVRGGKTLHFSPAASGPAVDVHVSRGAFVE